MYEGALRSRCIVRVACVGHRSPYSDCKVPDELHATVVAEHKVSPGSLVGVVRQAGIGSCRLSPLVRYRTDISPATLMDKMKESRKVSNIAIKVASKKSGSFWPKQDIVMACLDDFAGSCSSPWRTVASSMPIDSINMYQAT